MSVGDGRETVVNFISFPLCNQSALLRDPLGPALSSAAPHYFWIDPCVSWQDADQKAKSYSLQI